MHQRRFRDTGCVGEFCKSIQSCFERIMRPGLPRERKPWQTQAGEAGPPRARSLTAGPGPGWVRGFSLRVWAAERTPRLPSPRLCLVDLHCLPAHPPPRLLSFLSCSLSSSLRSVVQRAQKPRLFPGPDKGGAEGVCVSRALVIQGHPNL